MSIKKLSLLILFLSGCATSADLKPGAGGEKISVQNKKYSEIWKAANRVMSQQLTIISADKQAGAIKAEKSAGVTTWGEVSAIFISPADENASSFTIEVQSLKRSRYQLTGQDWTKTITQGIKAELDLD